ncbi:MAG: aminoacyl-tRNA hydrolase [bacterium]
MKLIVGLGNPGPKYEMSRHNTGFLVLDLIKENLDFPDFKENNKFGCAETENLIGQEKVLLVKPLTFMNNSGEAIRKLIDFYKLDVTRDLLIIYDDVDLDVGKFKTSGTSSAGHRGMESIIKHVGISELRRIRIGIGRDERIATEDYVLMNMSDEDYKSISHLFPQIKEFVTEFLQ